MAAGCPAPAAHCSTRIRDAVGDLPLVAEDLGHITPEVHELRKAIGVPGMKILQFAFAQTGQPASAASLRAANRRLHRHARQRHRPRLVREASDEERQTRRALPRRPQRRRLAWTLIRAAYTSVAETAIVPVQDILDLGSEARMNLPGEENDNWSWRLQEGALTDELADELRKLAEVSGRI